MPRARIERETKCYAIDNQGELILTWSQGRSRMGILEIVQVLVEFKHVCG